MKDAKLAALAAGLAIAACSAAAQPAGSRTQSASLAPHTVAVPHLEAKGLSQEISCDVTAEPTPNGVLIEAWAFANEDVDAEYDLVITKSGGGGSSDVSQGGEVAMLAGTSETLGQTELSVERGARVSARLTVRDEHGELCRQSFRL